MRQRTYLNVILTVNALLLACLLWTQVAAAPFAAQTAIAQEPRLLIPNAAEQRKKMIDAMEQINQSIDAQHRLLKSGAVTVKVANLDEIHLEAPAAH